MASAAPAASTAKPTIVLVHGAWADSSSWAGVTAILQQAGYPVLVAPNDLRSLSGDSAELDSFLAQRTTGPVVLVGHSYGGAVVTDAATTAPNVRALVYVDAFIPDQAESLQTIIGKSTSALNVPDPTTVFDVNTYPGAPQNDADVYLKPSTFAADFAQDVPAAARNVLEAGQLPITLNALGEPSTAPAWKTIPSWAVIGTADKVLPAATQLAMATRAHATITKINASHLSLVSHPLQVAGVILTAARSVY
ncbi:alpha/beta hydrolase [Planctomonas sp. JC2975]|nr:alpha/beta hydrolase [Planctomonas sp. JC2975]